MTRGGTGRKSAGPEGRLNLFVTGAAGFVGRSFVRAASARGAAVTALSRDPGALPAGLRDLPGVAWVRGDLLEPGAWERALARGSTVVHLAATTGKLRAAAHIRGNLTATESLLAAARTAGARGVLHVSTIAVKFRDLRHYPYARAKARAEDAVRSSGVPFTIVRPTIVLGRGAPVLEGFARLARLPLVPVFGRGTARVQPVAVEDLARTLLGIAAADRFAGETIEVGGPDAVPIDDFVRRVRRACGRGEARIVHVPAAPVRLALALAEPLLLAVLPITAGQIATFTNDGTASGPPVAAGPSTSLDEALRDALAG